MFDGTNYRFKLSYYLTAMLPAYILFVMQISSRFYVQDLTEIILITSIIIIGILIALSLKKLINHTTEGYTTRFNPENLIYIRNGEVVSFLLGVIFPSVFIFSDNILVSIGIFMSIQMLIYNLMIRSSEVFPNVLMIMLGMDVYELTESNEYIIIFNKQLKKGNITKIGNNNSCNTYKFTEGED